MIKKAAYCFLVPTQRHQMERSLILTGSSINPGSFCHQDLHHWQMTLPISLAFTHFSICLRSLNVPCICHVTRTFLTRFVSMSPLRLDPRRRLTTPLDLLGLLAFCLVVCLHWSILTHAVMSDSAKHPLQVSRSLAMPRLDAKKRGSIEEPHRTLRSLLTLRYLTFHAPTSSSGLSGLITPR